VPEISRFHGIVIRVHWREHGKPHFHVECRSHKASIDIEKLQVNEGDLPPRVERIVLKWAGSHRRELAEAWRKAQLGQDPGKIAPPE